MKKRIFDNIKKNQRGGKRIGAGRKKASYTTKTISFRTRTNWVDEVKDALTKEKIRVEKQLKTK